MKPAVGLQLQIAQVSAALQIFHVNQNMTSRRPSCTSHFATNNKTNRHQNSQSYKKHRKNRENLYTNNMPTLLAKPRRSRLHLRSNVRLAHRSNVNSHDSFVRRKELQWKSPIFMHVQPLKPMTIFDKATDTTANLNRNLPAQYSVAKIYVLSYPKLHKAKHKSITHADRTVLRVWRYKQPRCLSFINFTNQGRRPFSRLPLRKQGLAAIAPSQPAGLSAASKFTTM